MSRAQFSWAVFDVGAFGFYSATFNTYAQMYFYNTALESGMSPHLVTAKWGYSVATAMLVSSVLAPIVGWGADRFSCRKLLLMTFAMMSPLLLIAATVFRSIYAKLLCMVFSYAGYALSCPIYNSFLPIVISDESTGSGLQSHGDKPKEPISGHDLSIESTWMGNAGGGVILMLMTALHLGKHSISDGSKTGSPVTPTEHQSQLVSFAVFTLSFFWWFLFSLPLWLSIKEPQATETNCTAPKSPLHVSASSVTPSTVAESLSPSSPPSPPPSPSSSPSPSCLDWISAHFELAMFLFASLVCCVCVCMCVCVRVAICSH